MQFFGVTILEITIRCFKFVSEILPIQPTIQPRAWHTVIKNACQNIHITRKTRRNSIGCTWRYYTVSIYVEKTGLGNFPSPQCWSQWVTQNNPSLKNKRTVQLQYTTADTTVVDVFGYNNVELNLGLPGRVDLCGTGVQVLVQLWYSCTTSKHNMLPQLSITSGSKTTVCWNHAQF